MRKKFCSFLAAIAGLALVLSACGPKGNGSGSDDAGNDVTLGDCASDRDCSGTRVCHSPDTSEAICVPRCNPDSEPTGCTVAEVCVPVASGANGCIPGDPDTGTPDDASPPMDTSDTGTSNDTQRPEDTGTEDTAPDATDTWTAPETGPDGGTPDTTSQSRYFVQIKDVTRSRNTADRDGDGVDDGEQMCQASPNAEGADIFAVELLDASGSHAAWGNFVVGNIVGGVYGNAGTVFDGTSPSLVASPDPNNGEQCPGSGGSTDFSKSTVVALGCGGNVVVGFQNSSGKWMRLQSGYSVVVYEYAVPCFKHDSSGNLQCKPSNKPVKCPIEHRETYLCDPTNDPLAQAGNLLAATTNNQGNFPQCTNSAGSGAGITTKVTVP